MSIRATTLREVASMLERNLIKDPCDEVEEHINDCYRHDINRIRLMADEAEKEGMA